MLSEQEEQLCASTFRPSRTDQGIPYPCLQSELDFHRLPSFPYPNQSSPVNATIATYEILWHNDPCRTIMPAETAAITRLQNLLQAFKIEKYEFAPDLAVKIFSDLDTVIFGGKLKGSVMVKWYFMEERDPTLTVIDEDGNALQGVALGFCSKTRSWERGQRRIFLNAHSVLESQHHQTWLEMVRGAMLHEMCHAHKYVRCQMSENPFKGSSADIEYKKGHDLHFASKYHVVQARSVTLFGCGALLGEELYRVHHSLGETWEEVRRTLELISMAQKEEKRSTFPFVTTASNIMRH